MELSSELRDAIGDYSVFLINLHKMNRAEVEIEMRALRHRLAQDADDEEYEVMQLLKNLVDLYGGKALLALGVPGVNVVDVEVEQDQFSF